jgi:16S rRNA C1402 (ribose-2'-O) methylase RsmI
MSGQLIFVGVDLGNVNDITVRALDIIKETNVFIVEDKGFFKNKLKQLNIIDNKKIYQWPNPTVDLRTEIMKKYSWQGISDDEVIKIIKETIDSNKNVVYCSSEGMPGTTDPGTMLVSLALKNKIPYTVCPGPSISSLILSHSAFASSEFIYKELIPASKKDQDIFLLDLLNQGMPCLFPYIKTDHQDSKTFILEFLDKVINIFPNDTLITIVINATTINELIINDFTINAKNQLLNYDFDVPFKMSFLIIPKSSGRLPEETHKEITKILFEEIGKIKVHTIDMNNAILEIEYDKIANRIINEIKGLG